MLLYGEYGTGKTLQLGRLARWWFEKTGEISRLISADSSWNALDDSLIVGPDNPGGIIEAWNVEVMANPWNALNATTKGAWPKVIQDTRGMRLKMIAGNMNAEGKLLSSDGKRIVGQVFYEGLSTLGNTGLADHIKEQRVLGQDVVGKFSSSQEFEVEGKNVSQSITLAKASPSHYGHVQDWLLLDMVPNSGRLPVSRVIWTGHEAKGTDDVTGIKDSVLGPLTVVKATVAKVVGKFGHSFHLTVGASWTKDAKGNAIVNRDFRAWFVNHPDEVLTKMTWPTKTSLPLVKSQELLRMFPGGFIPLDPSRGIEWYSEFLTGGKTDGSK